MGIIVRELKESDKPEVAMLDEISTLSVSNWLDSDEYAWGIFVNKILVGYCTIGYADDCGKTITNYPGWTIDSLLLSDVFITPEARKQGLATILVKEAIDKHSLSKDNLVFLTLLHDSLSKLYSKVGFELISEGIMVND